MPTWPGPDDDTRSHRPGSWHPYLAAAIRLGLLLNPGFDWWWPSRSSRSSCPTGLKRGRHALFPGRWTSVDGHGKTTTLRMMLGLVRPEAGTIRLFGTPVGQGARARDGVAGFAETPRFYPYLSARKNLMLCATL